MGEGCNWSWARGSNVSWRMCLYPDSRDVYVSRSIRTSGRWEGPLVDAMLAVLRAHRNATLVDIGAHVGFFTLAAASVGARVHAFEPVPSSADLLVRSLRMNRWFQGRVTLHTVALADAGAPAEVGMAMDPRNQGGVRHRASLPSPVRVPTSTLDALVAPSARPVFLKIDIEGGECDAIRGARRFLEESKRIVGVAIELRRASRGCCEEWIAPGGFFHRLWRVHTLAPQGHGFTTLCDGDQEAWDVLWL